MSQLKGLKIVFIGAGNMAEALVKGLLASKVCDPLQLFATDVVQARLDMMRQTYGIVTPASNADAVQGADLVCLAVKPQLMDEVLQGMKAALPAKALVVSIAAGRTCAWIEARLPAQTRLVRVMPNTPALVGAGVSALAAGTHATARDMDLTEAFLKSVGDTARVPENLMDAVTALSGSGPAYVFYMMEAMLQAAGTMGVPSAIAKQLIFGTFAGAARLAVESEVDVSVLRERVTSKGGTTAAALGVMDHNGIKDSFAGAVVAARDRSVELSKM